MASWQKAMFASPPTLHIRRPSPTTTEFTVTTLPPPSLSRTLFASSVLLLRVLLLTSTILVVGSYHSLFLPQLTLHLPPINPWILHPTALLILYAVSRRKHTEESLLVVQSLGVQISTTSGTWVGGGRKTRFIPTEKVRDIFIHEGFWGFEVKFYLAVVVEGEGELVVVFPTLLPDRKILEQVWRGARRCLYQPIVRPSAA